jgi:DNA-binding YbaB/EbfC family protein
MRNPLQSMFENQFAQVSENLTKALEELEAAEIEGSAGGGAVRVHVTGSGQILDVKISPAAVQPEDIELLEDLVCAAMRDAFAKATQLKKEKLMSATPLGALGLDVPNVF